MDGWLFAIRLVDRLVCLWERSAPPEETSSSSSTQLNENGLNMDFLRKEETKEKRETQIRNEFLFVRIEEVFCKKECVMNLGVEGRQHNSRRCFFQFSQQPSVDEELTNKKSVRKNWFRLSTTLCGTLLVVVSSSAVLFGLLFLFFYFRFRVISNEISYDFTLSGYFNAK